MKNFIMKNMTPNYTKHSKSYSKLEVKGQNIPLAQKIILKISNFLHNPFEVLYQACQVLPHCWHWHLHSKEICHQVDDILKIRLKETITSASNLEGCEESLRFLNNVSVTTRRFLLQGYVSTFVRGRCLLIRELRFAAMPQFGG